MEERYELHKRLQEAVAMGDVAYRDFRAAHFIAYTTFYAFCRNPEIARPKTLTSVRIAIEFIEAAVKAKLLPIPRHRRREKAEIMDALFTQWWANDKKFYIPKEEKVEILTPVGE